ncbi:TRAP transporter permease [Thermodesulfobacteriota bacterium]
MLKEQQKNMRDDETPDEIEKLNVEDVVEKLSVKRDRKLTGIWRAIIIIFGAVVVLLGINTVFNLRFFVDFHLFEFSLYYIVFGVLLAGSFLKYPIKRELKEPWASIFFWVDVGLCLLTFSMFMYFAWHGQDIIVMGWSRFAPPEAQVMAAISWLLILESIRRIYGPILFSVISFVSFYPLFASHMPGFLEGIQRTFDVTAMFHILSPQSAIGLLLRTYIGVVLGFILFGIVVVETGGGEFFLNLALSLVGRMRGGTSKVAVVASALFASINGQPMVNVLTTGAVTIPAMKKAGFAPHIAGAVEVCASTAGTFTPPIMGISAFIMASFLNVPYSTVAIAACVPAFLYYVGLYIQIDGYAVKNGLKGLKREELPSFWETLKSGWFYIPGALVLIYYLFWVRMIGISAFAGSATILVLAQIPKASRFTRPKLLQFLENSAGTLIDLMVVIGGVGMLVGVFSLTGIGMSFARELMNFSGGNLALLLVFSAVAGLIMGMGMTLLAVYIFLAVVLAPALVMAGIPELSAHMFCLYVGMLSYITPPIAMAAFPAAILAKTSAMKVGVSAARLGGVKYLLPFLFVLDPGLLLIGKPAAILFSFVTALLGIFIIGASLEGYMQGLGRLWAGSGEGSIGGYKYYSYVLRTVLVCAGVLLGLPWLHIKITGFAISAVILIPTIVWKVWHGRMEIKAAAVE